MEKFGTKHFIYSSSATVYGAPTVSPISESTPLQPKSAYGRTKFMCELIIKDAAVADRGLRAISLRYFNPAGSHPTGKMGESPRGKPGNLLPLLAQLAVGKYQDEGLQVFGNDDPTRDGTCVRDYIHGGPRPSSTGNASLNLFYSSDGSCARSCRRPNGARGREDVRPGPFVCGHQLWRVRRTLQGLQSGQRCGISVLQMIDSMREATGFDYQYEVVDRRCVAAAIS